MKAKTHNLIVGFEGLTDEQFAVVAGTIEALGQHTCSGSYFDIPDVTDTDIALLYGVGALTGRLSRRDLKLDPQSARAELAWKGARKKYEQLERLKD